MRILQTSVWICGIIVCMFFLSHFYVSSVNEQKDSKPELKDVLPTFQKVDKLQRIEDRLAQEWEMTRDVNTGKVPRKDLIKAKKVKDNQMEDLISKTAIAGVQWDERGPNNVGGRTRALMFDPNDNQNKKAWAGGVGGGIWYSDDITASNANWQRVDDFWSNMAVTSIAHDPVNTLTFYVGTGEGFGNADAIDGDGIWKSTNGGSTWTNMANTTSFNDCNRIICFKTNHILVATNNGLQLSTNSGSSWTTVRSGNHSDVEVAANGDLYAGTFGGDVYKSDDDGATWTGSRIGAGSRVELSTAPSNANVVYAIINSGSDVTNILQSSDAGGTWVDKTIPLYKEQGSCVGVSNVFTRGQGWYDLISLVSPSDPNKIIVGGVDLHRSEDGGATWESISYWTGTCDAYVHADQHALISRPGNSSSILAGNDGGVYYSDNAFTTNSNPVFQEQNENYNVTQFYAAALHPGDQVDNILLGAQDNGSKRLQNPGIGAAINESGGDGAFCHIDQDQPNLQYTSYVYNNYYYTTDGASFTSKSVGNTGRFINPTDYDDETNTLYACADDNTYLILEGLGSGAPTDAVKSVGNFGGKISCVKVSPNVTNRVYFGISGQRICRIDNANTTPVFTDLGTPATGYVSSIDVEVGNENHIIATYSNYGMTSVWESSNGGTTWISIEGDLPNMPVRWGIFDPGNADQVLLATELGVWSTNFVNGSSTDWDPTNSGLANTRVDMLESRASDKLVVAATHGRGAFTTTSLNLNCNIGAITLGAQDCDPNTDTYSQVIEVILNNTPSSGQLTINGVNFAFPFDQITTIQTYTLEDLVANGLTLDLVIAFTAESTCGKTITEFIQAPLPGCALDNNNCADAAVVPGAGTYAANGPADGNGCNNCTDSAHADWFKFTPDSDGAMAIRSCGYGVDTRLFIYSGSCSSLTLVASNDDACIMGVGLNAYASEVTNVSVISGTTYYIEWDNRWSNSGFDFDIEFLADEPACSLGNKVYVDADAVVNGLGCSWETPFKNLQDAIDLANTNPAIQEIWLKVGTYYPTNNGVLNRNSSFIANKTLTIYGGFDGTEVVLNNRDYDSNLSILSGDLGIANVNIDNCYHVIEHSNSSLLTLDGLVIEKGNENSGSNEGGAGLYNTGNTLVMNCIFRDHISSVTGSAIVNSGATANIDLMNILCTNNAGIASVNKNNGNVTIMSGSPTIMQ